MVSPPSSPSFREHEAVRPKEEAEEGEVVEAPWGEGKDKAEVAGKATAKAVSLAEVRGQSLR